VDDAVLQRMATATTVLIFTQILVGATMRHTGAGLAIPDFPLMFGHLLPDHWDQGIAIHFAHRAGALLVTLAVLVTSSRVRRQHRDRRELTLGAFTVLSGRDIWINSAHVVCGALVLTTSLVLALRTWRVGVGSPLQELPGRSQEPQKVPDPFGARA
jgi:cytochrome c oxidase assembly protein subunit 15